MNLQSNDVFLFNEFNANSVKYLGHQGGTSSGKTYNTLIWLLFKLIYEDNKLITVVSETITHLEKGAYRDFKKILSDNDLYTYFEHKLQKRTFVCKSSKSSIEFTSFDTEDKAKGGRRDYLFINEAYAVPYNIALQLFIRTKKNIIIDFNPVSSFWYHSEIEPRIDCKTLITTYKNNPFLDLSIIQEIESRKNNEAWFRVYGLGLTGSFEGLVFPNVELIETMPNKFQNVKCMDLGFTNDPTVLLNLEIDFKNKTIYIDELFFKNMTFENEIENVFIKNKFNSTTEIVTDTNEPRLIHSLYTKGWNVHNAKKIDKMFQISEMRIFKIKITKRSLNVISEFRGLNFKKNRDGKAINDIAKQNDHSCDAARYGFWYLFQNANVNNVFKTNSDLVPNYMRK